MADLRFPGPATAVSPAHLDAAGDGNWFKSSFSASGNCIEVKITDSTICVRDSKNRQGSFLTFNSAEWKAFLKGVRHGEFDL